MAFAGKDFLIQLQTSDGPPEVFTTIGGMRSTSMSLNNEDVDVTDKDDMPWRQLEDFGVRSMEMSGSGIFKESATLDSLVESVVNGPCIKRFRLISGSGRKFTGDFKINLELSGEYNGAEQYSVTLASAGVIDYVKAPI